MTGQVRSPWAERRRKVALVASRRSLDQKVESSLVSRPHPFRRRAKSDYTDPQEQLMMQALPQVAVLPRRAAAIMDL